MSDKSKRIAVRFTVEEEYWEYFLDAKGKRVYGLGKAMKEAFLERQTSFSGVSLRVKNNHEILQTGALFQELEGLLYKLDEQDRLEGMTTLSQLKELLHADKVR